MIQIISQCIDCIWVGKDNTCQCAKSLSFGTPVDPYLYHTCEQHRYPSKDSTKTVRRCRKRKITSVYDYEL